MADAPNNDKDKGAAPTSGTPVHTSGGANPQNQPALDPRIQQEQNKQVTTEGQKGQTTDATSMNPTDEPAAAQQSGMGTQPSQTLNPESPASPAGKVDSFRNPNDRVKVKIVQGKHKYIENGVPKVADSGAENDDAKTLYVDQRTIDRFPGRFQVI